MHTPVKQSGKRSDRASTRMVSDWNHMRGTLLGDAAFSATRSDCITVRNAATDRGYRTGFPMPCSNVRGINSAVSSKSGSDSVSVSAVDDDGGDKDE